MEDKFLLIMRHAKSDWSQGGKTDFERDLNSRGIEASPKMGLFLKNANFTPTELICSPALRAHRTANLVAMSAGFDAEQIQLNRAFYYGTAEDYFTSLKAIKPDTNIALLVGHNPLVENFIGLLSTGTSSPILQMPTAGIACFSFYAEKWGDLLPGSAKLNWFMIPKMLA